MNKHLHKFLCGLCFLLLSAASFAQKQHLEMTGTMNATGDIGGTLFYKLSVDINGVKVTGTSVTTQNGNELRASVSGVINPDKHLLIFTETKSLGGSLADSLEMCLFNVMVKWKEKRGRFVATGAFIGKNAQGAVCSSGSAELETPATDDSPLAPKRKERKTNDAPQPSDTVVETSGNRITEGIEKRLDWKGETCVMAIWDDGIEDGDAVTVLVDGHEMLKNYVLTKEKKIFNISIPQGRHTITLLAENEGVNPPCTAEITLSDGDVIHKLTAYNKKGKTASVAITKK
ncbi:MAG: hypothetical protein KF744_07940 [Taibaiella sp.]|nr:hypothetical protein [Taibaiella sp.]